ncbi:MAG TPA: type III-B CRISPR module RAMP protein Cmr1 [Chloroflexia bacterium]|nr:type III-B CRISPR module RAMP protein Cmr1 [Chloroflexia bacterium]
MSRPRPPDPPVVPEVAPPRRAHTADGHDQPWATQTREYRLITPLFGGGVEPQEADPVTVVRGSTVRGQLRFWWRACRAGHYSTVAALKQAEDLLWGAASTEQDVAPAPVQITVMTTRPGRAEKPFTVVSRDGRRAKAQANEAVAPAYAAFPLQPDDKSLQAQGVNLPTKAVQVGVGFTLTLTYPPVWGLIVYHISGGAPDDGAPASFLLGRWV